MTCNKGPWPDLAVDGQRLKLLGHQDAEDFIFLTESQCYKLEVFGRGGHLRGRDGLMQGSQTAGQGPRSSPRDKDTPDV